MGPQDRGTQSTYPFHPYLGRRYVVYYTKRYNTKASHASRVPSALGTNLISSRPSVVGQGSQAAWSKLVKFRALLSGKQRRRASSTQAPAHTNMVPGGPATEPLLQQQQQQQQQQVEGGCRSLPAWIGAMYTDNLNRMMQFTFTLAQVKKPVVI
eukprot:733593-Pelagomonas_calceolata.AAC.2